MFKKISNFMKKSIPKPDDTQNYIKLSSAFKI